MIHTSVVLLFLHSILRYLIIIVAVYVCLVAAIGLLGKKEYSKKDRLGILLLQIFCDVQLLLGLFIYYAKGWLYQLKSGLPMHDHYSRFYGMEHPLAMIIALILVHIGYANAKKNQSGERKYKRVFWYVFIALFIFVAQTPWPGKKDIGRPFLPVMNVN